MEKSKIKNIIILLLVLMNLFLLFIVISNARQTRQSEKLRDEAIRAVLFDSGISIGEGAFPEFVPSEIILKRDLDREKDMITSLIGRCTVEDLGGNIYLYSGGSNTVRLSGTGEIDVSFDSGTIYAGGDPTATAISVLAKMGIECKRSDAVFEGDSDSFTITLNCSYDGETVFNSKITCYFNSGRLTLISGRRLLDDVYSKASPENYPDAVTILMNFLAYIKESGEVCTAIREIDSGYYAETAVIGDFRLLPLWRIVTDVGSYYFDGLTGDVLLINS